MQFTLTYENENGDVLDLANNDNFILTDVDGLTAVDVDITTATVALSDGTTITNTRTEAREINLYLRFAQNISVEAAKRAILAVIKPAKKGTLYFDYNGRDVSIEVTTAAITVPRFSESVIMQINLYAAKPYWTDAAAIVSEVSYFLGLFHFEMTVTSESPIVFGKILDVPIATVTNDGDAPTGITFNLVAVDDGIENPKIERTADGAYFELDGVTMNAGDQISIVTTRGQKTVTKNGVNIINNVAAGSTWFQMEIGNNEFMVLDDSGGEIETYIIYRRAFV